MSFKSAILAALVFAGSSLTATAAVMTFDGPAFNGPVYTEAGGTITANLGSPNNVNTTGSMLGFGCCPGIKGFDWSLTTGGLFDLVSIFVDHTDGGEPVTFTGLLNGAVVATQAFNGNNNLAFIFGPGFTGLDEVRITMAAGTFGDPRFDRLEFVPVPLPAALPLLLVAVGGLAVARRRARARS